MSRFQLNFSRNVGKVAYEIRKCQPRSLSEWESYYFSEVHDEDHLRELGHRLYVKITEVLQDELEAITLDDCIGYIREVVIERTYEGYCTERRTVSGKLEATLEVKLEPATDEMDRHYAVDYIIRCAGGLIGLQIKPVTDTSQITRIFTERSAQLRGHAEFNRTFMGKVFYVFSMKTGESREIANLGVISEIREEIARLGGTP
jgi:hypothetical protein